MRPASTFSIIQLSNSRVHWLRIFLIWIILKLSGERRNDCMPQTIQTLLTQYLSEVQKIYGAHLKSVILYGSYARGDY